MIIKIVTPITRKIISFLLKIDEDFLVNEADPHLEHTILPPKDRSETNAELPQLRQTLFALITN
ncbi:hypothetical protein [uncultured Prochlorococcus sp.]|uniref:hypothetical protein n=1 Tax=uncultured Prochlorococcus sp. TaxID=159733 RepID=UPI00258F7067|nr:hypothetical protein [uncultured Prochlorococcus sp.]